MRYVAVLLLGMICGLARAQDAGELRLIQARAAMPSLWVWLNLPADTELKPEQFTLSVGPQAAGVKAVEPFRNTGEGVAYIFLVDISKSLHSREFQQIKRSLLHWLEGMGPEDRAALISFGRQVVRVSDFTADRFSLGKAIEGLAATDMETALYGGLLEAIGLGRNPSAGLPGRRAIVVLSDGMDDSLAGVSVDEVFKQSREYRVPIYSIGFAVPPLNEQKRDGLKVLGMLSRQSGGYFVQADPAQLELAYEKQQQLIARAYRLSADCPQCVADGQLQHINLTWSDGRRTLSDSLDMRLLPAAQFAAPQAPGPAPAAGRWPVLLLALAVLAFLLGLILVYRQRLAQPGLKPATEIPPPAAVVPMARPVAGLAVKLTVVAGAWKGRMYQLNIAEQVTLGRADNCDLCLNDDVEISNQHTLLQMKNGKLISRDLNSTNGTLINGVPIHNDYPLRSGDLLLLGRTELRIEF
ncbi:FHA domain-containing protein [Methylomonas sp. SURF-2]|uniref:FHA domain-containing protein n=1 Tax=Methylomonas subterranea TaxID=2952225 RepID=A0ABT1TI08_9GAMM|nr:FHA domain-containing protein [Methylomonas sp. SURF-2]MCQ8105095.1 FHA domain-containing protein [Methylomonas sp. SURF-2]